jgi:hypothetical protein
MKEITVTLNVTEHDSEYAVVNSIDNQIRIEKALKEASIESHQGYVSITADRQEESDFNDTKYIAVEYIRGMDWDWMELND